MGEAKRDNTGKPRLSLVPSALKRACARAMMYGLEKYSMHNWRQGGEKMSYHYIMDSFNRHAEDLLDGKEYDEESGLHQLDHMAANLAFLCELVESGKIVDDRYKESKIVRLEITEDTEFISGEGSLYGYEGTFGDGPPSGLCAPSVFLSAPGTPDPNSPLMDRWVDKKDDNPYNKIKDTEES